MRRCGHQSITLWLLVSKCLSLRSPRGTEKEREREREREVSRHHTTLLLLAWAKSGAVRGRAGDGGGDKISHQASQPARAMPPPDIDLNAYCLCGGGGDDGDLFPLSDRCRLQSESAAKRQRPKEAAAAK